ncbi:hypothetical protein [Persicitalea jodogahamensis]|uniref:Outer membrane protein beta-barrel domain-containing protein n=1 Tax=Persicitalea jodogahamensis TaxID=402147 RepID=A0A8J3D7F7_9BACT|nr:hypothetical protein [Persicitalea jodogahamensis]GHB56308.1 hypothetical protein GCM10007390_07040 [Persicitalea jodogahamensis]
MRNFLILASSILFPILSKAQFKAGQIFFQGGFNLSLSDSKYLSTYGDSQFGNYSHDISYSSGYFTDQNRAIGWTLNQSLSLAKIQYSGNTNDPAPTLQSIGFGGGRFVEHYKSLSDKFALYVRPGFNLSYTLQNQDDQQNGNAFTRTQTNTFTLGADVSAGVAWLLSPKWALYGGFAFANPISISAGWRNTESTTQNSGRPTNRKGSFFNYNLSPNLSSGSISLGFRYLVTRSTTY